MPRCWPPHDGVERPLIDYIWAMTSELAAPTRVLCAVHAAMPFAWEQTSTVLVSFGMIWRRSDLAVDFEDHARARRSASAGRSVGCAARIDRKDAVGIRGCAVSILACEIMEYGFRPGSLAVGGS